MSDPHSAAGPSTNAVKSHKERSPSTCSTLESHASISSTSSASPSLTKSSLKKKPVDTGSLPIRLETLLVGGQRKAWDFDPESDINLVKQTIWSEWPQDWPQPKPASEKHLRILHLGHILDDPKMKLASRGMKPGHITVVHIITRATAPGEVGEKKPESELKKVEEEETPGCRCVIC
ncbi:hypothetical protein IE53DRAFT_363240 [Violaceomyces palustris]|uniref:Uncharacterized protein n=1 Tax=Violaceomyces palustris TaxID=1673888 RepID=A0ACD0NU53_9BASI|nr:hypothetical protein IE53DRAFT_363240 [Violaceomyces palustris]